ncbi:MAG: aminomethyl-transferring glycine dehydrogenase subunit GcvPA [Muribaculaceae bacterium]|nr:aminomethyl-transferring glycine dehydrogenase subunit GcvPA [Muribaculaceae bacterium]MDE6130856.1 aminomethyl-transferring glycine dehydrogenase subunit GcvPA [Muribaculaceae bacterium]
MNYLPHTPQDISLMLERCGVSSIDDLYADIDPSLRFNGDYDLPEAMCESEIRRFFSGLSAKNRTLTCFAGAGFYDHYTPAAIDSILSRSEFLTAYTPYQPEISQGTLQYIFEYQTLMTRLTGMEVSNASMYDGATATAEAMLMAVSNSRRKRRVLISATVNPAVAAVVGTYARWQNIALEVIPEHRGAVMKEEFEAMMEAGDVAGVIVQTPNYYGILEDYEGWADICHRHKALLIMNAPASALAVIRTPGEWGADIACGDAQSLGMPLNYGGPYLGYICTGKSLIRKMPGRIVGATTDENGERVFVLTLQAREQHIRREKATSNICSNQGLMALHTAVYLSLMGPEGMRRVNALGADGLRRLADGLADSGVMSLMYPERPVLNEALFKVADGFTPQQIVDACKAAGILAGVTVGDDGLLVAVTENRTLEEIDLYISTVKSLKS